MPDPGHHADATPSQPAAIRILHAGALTSLIKRGLGPAFARETGIAVMSERGHSVALATAIRAGEKTGDIFMSADASVNATLMGAENGDLVRWHIAFARKCHRPRLQPEERSCRRLRTGAAGSRPVV